MTDTAQDADPSRRTLLSAVAIGLLLLAIVTVVRFTFVDAVDRPIIMAMNTIAGRSPYFDLALRAFDRFTMFQGVLLMSIAAAAFAHCNGTGRLRLAAGLFGASVAAVISRGSQILAPFAPRPMFDPAIPFRAPIGSDQTILKDWSSYPSDHAALLFGIACAIFLVRPRLGLLAGAIAVTGGIIRVYEGAHYLTDSIAGWLIAAVVVCAVASLKLTLTPRLAELARQRRGLLAMAGFFMAVEAAYLYEDIREFLSSLAEHL